MDWFTDEVRAPTIPSVSKSPISVHCFIEVKLQHMSFWGAFQTQAKIAEHWKERKNTYEFMGKGNTSRSRDRHTHPHNTKGNRKDHREDRQSNDSGQRPHSSQARSTQQSSVRSPLQGSEKERASSHPSATECSSNSEPCCWFYSVAERAGALLSRHSSPGFHLLWKFSARTHREGAVRFTCHYLPKDTGWLQRVGSLFPISGLSSNNAKYGENLRTGWLWTIK